MTYLISADADAWLDESVPGANHGGDAELGAKSLPGGGMRPVLHFDLSSLPAGITITSARVALWTTVPDDSGDPVNVYRVTRSFAEAAATWSNLATDHDSTTVYGRFSAQSPGLTLVDVTALAGQWARGDHANDGMMLIPTSPGVESRFASREASIPSRRPRLIVEAEFLAPGFTDLAVSMTVSDPSPSEMDPVTYTVSVRNDAAGLATGIEVLDLLPAGIVHTSDLPSQGSYTPGTGLWLVGSIAGGDSASLRIDATVAGGTAGSTITNTASVTASDQVDTDPTNDEAASAIDVVSPPFRVATGSYVGDGAAGRTVTGLGFPPDLILVQGDAGSPTVARSSTMVGDAAKPLGPASGLAANRVTSLDADGFTLGSDPDVNGPGIDYYWVAFRASPGVMAVGSYVGDKVDNRAITGLGLRPGYAIVMNEGPHPAIQRFEAQDGDASLQFDASGESPNRIQSFESDGFRIGKSNTVNESGVLHHYVAWKSTTGTVAGDVYFGNGSDDRDIVGAGLLPMYVLVKERWGFAPAVHRPGALAGDATLAVDAGPAFGNGIQAFLPDGFQVGTSSSVNGFLDTYYWVAFRDNLSADLFVTKSVADPAPKVGDVAEFTILVGNDGPDAASGVVLTDVLPAGLTYVSDTPGQGSYDPATGIWTVGTVGAGSTFGLTVRAAVDSGTGGTTITNQAAVTASSVLDPVSGNDSATVDLTVQSADLAVTKTVDDPAPNEGGSIIYTVSVTNLGPDAAAGVVVTDLLPAGVTFQFATPSQGTYDPATGEWAVGSLPAGAAEALAILVTVDSGAGGSTITNTALVTASDQEDPDGGNDSYSAGITVPSADLEITKTVDDPAPNEGDLLAYTIRIANLGPDAATGVAVTDVLPAGLTYQSSLPGQGAYSSTTGIWSVGAIAAGDSATLTLGATVDPGTGGTVISNVATVTAADQADPAPANDAATADIDVQLADLGVKKTVNNPAPSEGSTITYAVTVANLGPDLATGIVVADSLPAGVTFQSALPGQGSYADSTGLWTVGGVAAGDSATLFLTAIVDSGSAGSTITNTARVEGADQADANALNDSASVDIHVLQIVVLGSSDLAVVKSVDVPDPNEADSVAFAVLLTNLGPDPATGVEVSDLLPAGLTYRSHSASGGSYGSASGMWVIGPVAVADTLTLELLATVDAGTAGTTIVNTAAVSAVDQGDPLAKNDADSALVAVRAADLAVAKSVDDPTPYEGSLVTYTVELVNLGPDSASAVQVTDLLPGGLTYVSSAPGRGTYADSSGSWTVGTLAAGDTVALDLRASVDPGMSGSTITNTARVTAADQGDPFAGNDSSAVDISPKPVAQIALREVSGPASVSEGQAGSVFRLRIENLGFDSVGVDSVALDFTRFVPGDMAGDFAVTPSPGNPDSIAALAEDWFAFTVDLLPSATSGPVTVDGYVAATDRGGGSALEDADADSTLALVVQSPPQLAGQPGTLRPAVLVPGTAGVLATVDVTNSGEATVTLDSTSVLRVAAPGDTLEAGLDPAGGSDFGNLPLRATTTLTFGPFDVPGTFPEGTHPVWLSLAGADANGAPFADLLVLGDSVVATSSGVALAGTQLEGSVRPGARGVTLLTLAMSNATGSPLTLRKLDLENTTRGPGDVDAKDAELGSLSLYLDDGNGKLDPDLDTFLAGTVASGGRIRFVSVDTILPDGGIAVLHVGADLPLAAPRDGDSLDVRIAGAGDVTFDQDVVFLNPFPIDPAGSPPVDGMVAAQIARQALPTTEAFQGSQVLALDAVLPANGYEADTLQAVGVVNLGNAVPGVDLGPMSLWSDGGNGVFDGSGGDDVLLGTPVWTGSGWALAGLSVPVPVPGRRVFVSMAVTADATPGRTLLLGLPKSPGGLQMTSGNDGPLDAVAAAPDTLTIRGPMTSLEVTVAAQSGLALLPGVGDQEVFRFRIVNPAAVAETLTTITLANTTAGLPGATQADLDAEWLPLNLVATNRVDIVDPGRGGVFAGFSQGAVTFSGLSVRIAPGDTTSFLFLGGAALAARDGDALDLALTDSTRLGFTRTVDLLGSWPLDPPGAFPVDGMTAAQISLPTGLPPTLLTGSTRNLALEAVIPANGYEADTLRFLDLRNAGSAVPGSDLLRVEAWWDYDGNGSFDPVGGDAPGLLGELLFTGDLWQRTGLSLAVPDSGRRLFVSCDIAPGANPGETVRFVFPTTPVAGLGMDSANDGPIDAEAGPKTAQTITTADRVSLSAVLLPPGSTFPGETDVPLLHLKVTNNYDVTRTLSGLTVTNVTSGAGVPAELDAEVSRVVLRADSSNPGDPILAQSFFSGGEAVFTGFTIDLAPAQTREIFVAADVSLADAADGDILGAQVTGDFQVVFTDTTTVSASWPLDSQAARTIDGMRRDQVTNHGAPPATVGPGEGPVLALDVTVPSNGYAADVLQGVVVQNLGTADSTDLSVARLWRDGGNGSFDAGGGDDTDLGPFALLGGAWTSPALTEPLDPGGRRYFVSVTISAAPTDSAEVQLAIPVNGLTVQSANDGPTDDVLANGAVITLSTAVLLANLELLPDSSIVSQTVTARMTVRNTGAAPVDSIVPSILVPDVGGILSPLAGPVPAMIALLPDSSATFTWTFRADAPGTERLTGAVTGKEQGSGLTRQSLGATSNDHEVFLQAETLDLFPIESMPFSINRGQTDVVPLNLTLVNGGPPGTSDIRFLHLDVRLEDEAGIGIVPADLLSRVVVKEGANVYLDRTVLETTGDTLHLDLTQPVLVPAQQQATLSLSIDVADSTTIPSFRLVIPDSTWFTARDAVSDSTVAIALDPGASYPIRSGLARVVAEATRLDVAGTPDPPASVGQGQDGVAMLRLALYNPDPDSLAADVRVSSFEVILTDSSGAVPRPPSRFLDRIRVKTAVQTLLDRPVTANDDSTLALFLSPLLSVPVETSIPLTVEVDIGDTAALGPIRLRLADSTSFDARDANTGIPLPVVYATIPVEGPIVTVESPADSILVAGVPHLPATVPVGEVDVRSLTVVLTHPGAAETAPILADSITVQCRDQASQPLVPSVFVDRARVLQGGNEIALITNLPASGGEFTVPLPGVVIAPGETDSLEIRFDVEVTAPATLFAMHVGTSGIHVVDGDVGTPVAVRPDSGTALPLTSGLAQLEAPARELAVGFDDALPAVLVADGSTVVFATLSLRNPAPPTSGDILVDHLVVRAADGDLAPIDLGSALSSVTAYAEGALWADSGDLSPTETTATLTAGATKAFAPGPARKIELRATLREGATVPSLRLGFVADGIGVVQPSSPLLSVTVLPEDGMQFPFWTQPGNFTPTSLAESWSNFPNPFAAGRSQTRFAFFLPQPGRVSLRLWTVRGDGVRTILDAEPRGTGLHQDTTWDGRNGRGDIVVNGVYLAEITVAFDDGTRQRHLRKVAVVR